MGLKVYKPTTPGQRGMILQDFKEVTKKTPEKRLTKMTRRMGSGMNNQGIVTSRFRGGGVKRKYRMVDFRRDKDAVPAKVAAIEYDPNRNCRIALLFYKDGEKRYILCPEGLEVGMDVMSGPTAEPKVGCAMQLANVPLGLTVHNVEFRPGEGGRIARSAGAGVQLSAKEAGYAFLIMPSSEVRKVRLECRATIGRIGNEEFSNINWGKAGKTRHRGRKGHSRAGMMNPCDHPLGGRAHGGRHPVSPWGKHCKGMKTRKHKNLSNQFIVRRRQK